ncbi:MAG: hypothetical protein AB8F65_14155 [Woeseiaceae bacterium]
MPSSRQMSSIVVLSLLAGLSGCATLTNDANIPLSVSFSDGSAGQCTFSNKRGSWDATIPSEGTEIRRSDDDLQYSCTTSDDRRIEGKIESEIDQKKWWASVVFLDFGLTDSITDKHRTYQRSPVIDVSNDKTSGQ